MVEAERAHVCRAPRAPGTPIEVALLLDAEDAQLLRREFSAALAGSNTLRVAESVVLLTPVPLPTMGAIAHWLLRELGLDVTRVAARVAGRLPVLATQVRSSELDDLDDLVGKLLIRPRVEG